MEELISIINHSAWIEPGEVVDSRARFYVKWGHYPEIDGKLELNTVTMLRAVSVKSGSELVAVAGMDKEASRRGAIFIEAQPVKSGDCLCVALKYVRGPYALTKDGKWLRAGKRDPALLHYDVTKVVLIEGYAKTFLTLGEAEPKPLGLALELTPTKIGSACSEVEVLVTRNGKPVPNIEVEVGYADGKEVVKADDSGVARITVKPPITVLTARADVDEASEDYDAKRIVSTLTLTMKK